MSMYRDLVSNVRVHAGDDGDSIDLREFDSVIVVSASAIAEVEVSDVSDDDFEAADSDDLIERTDENGANVIGYIGSKRYLKVTGDAADESVIIGYRLHRAPEGFEVESRLQD